MKNQVKLEKKVMEFANTMNAKGYALKDVMMALFHRGLLIFNAEEGHETAMLGFENGKLAVTTALPGYEIGLRPALGKRLADPEAMIVVGDLDKGESRVEMSVQTVITAIERDHALIGALLTGCYADHPASVTSMRNLLGRCSDQFEMYRQSHAAKGTPESDAKAIVNRGLAVQCALAAGIATPTGSMFDLDSAENRAEGPQESDSELPAPSEAGMPRAVSDAPLDRDEVLAWIDMKIEGATKNGMEEARGVLVALRGEIAQHLEAAPIDFETALRGFYADVYARNVKAGWWNDLATGESKKRNVGELLILFVTEIAEAYNAYVENAADDKLPHMPGLTVELADLQIRLADFCGALLAGNIVAHSAVRNPGDAMFREIVEIANRYEAIRKTEAAVGDPERGELLPASDTSRAAVEKIAFNAVRKDHQIENRMKDDGKRT